MKILRKRSASNLILLFILCSTLLSLPQIKIVRASGTIYIRSDGSIEGTDKIRRDGNVYTFTYNIFDQTIVVKKDNIVVDGAGFTLQGAGAYDTEGIDLSGRSNVTIKNIRVSNTHYGIYLDESFNNSIVGNYITDNSNIALISSSNNNVTGNNIINNQGNGIYFVDSSNNTISGNNITNNNSGIYFLESSNNIVSHNNFINNTKHVEDADFDHPWVIPLSVNIWDDGVEGNYWSDYEARYPNATELDGSGIWGTPYVIYGNNQDNYPLMNPVIITEFTNDEKSTTPTTNPFPTWIVAAIVIIAVVGAALLVYFVKIKKTTGKTEIISEGVM